MKRLTLTLAFVALAFTVTQSQNYELVKTGNTNTFNNPSKTTTYHVIHVDSMSVQGSDTVYSLYNSPGGAGCPQLDGPSWMGESITKTASHNYIFHNLFGEEILIQNPGSGSHEDSWICWENEDSYVEATITGVEQESFLGFTDSVKVITFQKYDSEENEEISSAINGKKIKVSKHHQMIHAIPMVMFPDIPRDPMPGSGTYIYPESGLEFVIKGMTNPQTGIYNIETQDIFDYEVGDEFHIEKHTNKLASFNSTDSAWMQYRVLDRNDGDNFVTYEMERIRRDKYIEYDDQGDLQDSSVSIIFDTVTMIYSDDDYLNALPFESIRRYWNEDSTNAEVVHHRLTETDFGRNAKKTGAYSDNWSWEAGDDCLYYAYFDGCGEYNYHYYEELGGPYYQCFGPFYGTILVRKLVYFHQGEEEWGEPLNILGMTSRPTTNNSKMWRVYPNPVKERITIETPDRERYGRIRFIIRDISGKKLLSKKLVSDQTTFVPDLAGGIYFYCIETSKNILNSGKLIIQK